MLKEIVCVLICNSEVYLIIVKNQYK